MLLRFLVALTVPPLLWSSASLFAQHDDQRRESHYEDHTSDRRLNERLALHSWAEGELLEAMLKWRLNQESYGQSNGGE